jgi:hypothetical protein
MRIAVLSIVFMLMLSVTADAQRGYRFPNPRYCPPPPPPPPPVRYIFFEVLSPRGFVIDIIAVDPRYRFYYFERPWLYRLCRRCR